MNILFVSAVFPYPLFSGGQVRIYNVLKHLSKKHSITLFSFIRKESENQYKKNLSFLSQIHTVYRGSAWQFHYVAKALFSSMPWLLATYDSHVMREEIQKELQTKKYDLVHIEPFYVMPSIPKITVPLVIGEHNIEYDVYKKYGDSVFPLLRPFLKQDVKKILLWEQRSWKQASHIVTVSKDDEKVIHASDSTVPVTVVPNGVDVSTFSCNTHEIKELSLRCLFVGNFLWLPNREAANTLIKSIWPVIVRTYPHAKLSIVGKNGEKFFHNNPTLGITIQGEVDDIKKEYREHDILLAPMGISGGTKFKILEAMASGLIVITTSAGILGLPVSDGKEVLIRESPSTIVDSIGKILNNKKNVGEIRKNARKFIETSYDWKHIADTLSHVWEKTL